MLLNSCFSFRLGIYLFYTVLGSVFTCSVSPRGDLVATGGEDDQAYVWDITSGNVIFTCAGHKVNQPLLLCRALDIKNYNIRHFLTPNGSVLYMGAHS